MNSRAKGKRGELDFCRFLGDHGFPARRGQQFAGGTDSPDVVCPSMPDVHHEVKRTERLHLHDALDQAIRDAVTKLPIVWYRRNGYGWVAQDQGTVRIPIAEAMRLTVERGLPVRQGGTADGLNMVVQDSSSGRTAAPR